MSDSVRISDSVFTYYSRFFIFFVVVNLFSFVVHLSGQVRILGRELLDWGFNHTALGSKKFDP